MSCQLGGLGNMSATFEYGIDQSISLPSVDGVSLGSIDLDVSVRAHFQLVTQSSDISIIVGGNFDFEGANLSFGDYAVDVPISTLSSLLSAIVSLIEKDAYNVFKNLLSSAVVWAKKVAKKVIKVVESVASVLQNVWNQGAQEAASTMKDAGFAVKTIASDIGEAFNLGPDEIHSVLKQVGFSDIDIGTAFAILGGPLAPLARSILGGSSGGIPGGIPTIAEGVPRLIIHGLLGDLQWQYMFLHLPGQRFLVSLKVCGKGIKATGKLR